MAFTIDGTNGLTFNNATTQATAYSGVNSQIFNANGTFTIPAGITKIKLTVCGGGGNGGAGYNVGCNANTGGGGGGAAIAIKWLTGLTPANTLTVTRGAASGSSSVASGTETITTITGGGGTAGGAGTAGAAGALGAAGTATNGDLNLSSRNFVTAAIVNGGGCATWGGINSTTTAITGVLGGTAGISSGTSTTPRNATGYGNGGAGGSNGTGQTTAGTGTAGIVIIEW